MEKNLAVLSKLNIELSYNPAIPLQGIASPPKLKADYIQ